MIRILNDLSEAFVSHTAISRAVSKGRYREASEACFSPSHSEPERTSRRHCQENLWGIVAGYDPGALVADRTALEAASASDGSPWLVSEQGPKVDLAGVVLGEPPIH